MGLDMYLERKIFAENAIDEGGGFIMEPNLGILNKYRVTTGMFATKENDVHGLFFIPFDNRKPNIKLKVLSSGILGQPDFAKEWYHVSVSLPNRCPTWEEMCVIKRIFYGDEVTVVQYHPKKSSYINNANFCLHLWARTDKEIELPPSLLVGI